MTSDATRARRAEVPNGGALAATLAAGIGSFALGVLVILGEAGVYAAPALYAPAGGLSGRSTFAVVAWLAAWFLLHRRWRSRDVAAGRVLAWTCALVACGAVMLFPPLWDLL